MKIQINDQEVYVDKALFSNMQIFKDLIKHDFDAFIVISGDEGVGKSKFAKQLCSIATDGKFSVDNIAFTPEQFKDRVINAKQYDAVLYDEGITGLHARAAMTKINRSLISMAAQCRKKNLFVIIIVPSFFDVDKNIALHRSRALIQIYTNKFERGFFAYYTKEQKKMLWINGKPTYNNKAFSSEFIGRFTKWSLIDEVEYEKRKDEALIISTEAIEGENKYTYQRNALIYMLSAHYNLTQERIALILSQLTGITVSDTMVSDSIASYKRKNIRETKNFPSLAPETLINNLKTPKRYQKTQQEAPNE